MTKKQQAEIRLQIISTEKEKFEVGNLEQIDSENIGQDDIEFSVEIGIASNLESEHLKIEIRVNSIEKETNELLFNITSATIFYSPDFDKLVDSNNNIIAPEDFIRKLMNISIGGTRGMLAILLANSDLSHLTFPLIDLGNLEEKEKIED